MNETTKIYPESITKDINDILGREGISEQFVATDKEQVAKAYELVDPIGDDTYSPVAGLVHRYPDRVLLKPISSCPVYCRFCFRREVVGKSKALNKEQLQKCFDYIKSKVEIKEVILTGGDPLFMKPKSLQNIFDNLSTIEHLDIIRLHTRVPSVSPGLITDKMIEVLKSFKPVYIVVHINHPNEFTNKVSLALDKLVDNGIVLLSQSVLLKGINDNIATLSKLMRMFIKNRVKPYYLHHLDMAPGTSHFRTSIQHGQKLVQELHGNFSGLMQLHYVLDIPGGFGKTPINPNYLKEITEKEYIVRDYNGKDHKYIDYSDE
jgi:lysine 2,3-aminomutase